MDVITRVVWWIELHDPIYARDVEAAGSNICAEQDTRFRIDEFEECVGALLLLLLSLDEDVRRR